MIRSTHAANPEYVVSAYSDNAAVLQGSDGTFLSPSRVNGEYVAVREIVNTVIKVETVSVHRSPCNTPLLLKDVGKFLLLAIQHPAEMPISHIRYYSNDGIILTFVAISIM